MARPYANSKSFRKKRNKRRGPASHKGGTPLEMIANDGGGQKMGATALSETSDYPPFGNLRHLGYSQVMTRLPGMAARDSPTARAPCNIHTILPPQPEMGLYENRNIKISLPPSGGTNAMVTATTTSDNVAISAQSPASYKSSSSVSEIESFDELKIDNPRSSGRHHHHHQQQQQQHGPSKEAFPIVDSTMISKEPVVLDEEDAVGLHHDWDPTSALFDPWRYSITPSFMHHPLPPPPPPPPIDQYGNILPPLIPPHFIPMPGMHHDPMMAPFPPPPPPPLAFFHHHPPPPPHFPPTFDSPHTNQAYDIENMEE